MLKGVDEHIEPTETHERARKASQSRDMLLALYGRVARLKSSMGDMKETVKEVDGYNTKLELRQDQLNNQMTKALSDNMDVMLGILNTIWEQIEELKGELNIYKDALGNEALMVAAKLKVDVSKSKEFNRTKSANDASSFLWGIEQYFRAKGITNDATKGGARNGVVVRSREQGRMKRKKKKNGGGNG
ncbi:hypothetical protein J1N35_019465 [Gossypium stocksii]|uniref:Uncharacterized protein n=1 Tax=Gossypium stocksii TaxID=47602 RepID=A0A9D3VT97_9ROSI|nr:hypothetical protein J1N35_019465 [Gossypium stocksii]